MLKSILNYIKESYASWLLALILLPFIIYFEKSLDLIQPLNHSGFITYSQDFLAIVFIISIIISACILNEFEFNKSLGYREYEKETLVHFKKTLYKLLLLFTLATALWTILIFTTIDLVSNHFVEFYYLLALPILANLGLLLLYKNISIEDQE